MVRQTMALIRTRPIAHALLAFGWIMYRIVCSRCSRCARAVNTCPHAQSRMHDQAANKPLPISTCVSYNKWAEFSGGQAVEERRCSPRVWSAGPSAWTCGLAAIQTTPADHQCHRAAATTAHALPTRTQYLHKQHGTWLLSNLLLKPSETPTANRNAAACTSPSQNTKRPAVSSVQHSSCMACLLLLLQQGISRVSLGS